MDFHTLAQENVVKLSRICPSDDVVGLYQTLISVKTTINVSAKCEFQADGYYSFSKRRSKMKANVLTGLAVAVTMIAGGAQALTTVTESGSFSQSGTATAIAATNGTATDVTFSWNGTPSSGYTEFTVDTTSYLYLASYSGSSTSAEYTGFMLYENGVNLTLQNNACNTSVVIDPVEGKCNLVTNFTGSGPIVNYHLTSTGTAYAILDAGSTYMIGFAELTEPATGSLVFQVSEGAYVPPAAAVPLPAGGMLLLGALGGIAALRRRRKAA